MYNSRAMHIHPVQSKQNRRPKLAYLSDGRSSHTAKWVNHFSEKQYEVHLLSFNEPRAISSGVHIHTLNAGVTSSLKYFLAKKQVKDVLASVQPDILHAHYASGYGTLGRLTRFHPYVVSVWGSDVYEFPSISPLHRYLLNKALLGADVVCSTSHVMAMHTSQYYSGKIYVTPFGVNCLRFRPHRMAPVSGDFVVGTVKSLEDKYGVDVLIRAFSILKRNYMGKKELRLVIGGEGSKRRELQRLAASCGISRETSFLGFVPQDEIPAILNTFSVFVALSITDSESFGVAVVEASACGLPVVVSDAGGLAEVVKDGITGMIVPRCSEGAAAAAIATFVDDAGRSRSMGMAGRDLVLRQYEWDENASRMEQLYASLIPHRFCSTSLQDMPTLHNISDGVQGF